MLYIYIYIYHNMGLLHTYSAHRLYVLEKGAWVPPPWMMLGWRSDEGWMKTGDGWMLLGGIDDVSVCNLENELPKPKARANRERERGRGSTKLGRRLRSKHQTSQLQTLRRWWGLSSLFSSWIRSIRVPGPGNRNQVFLDTVVLVYSLRRCDLIWPFLFRLFGVIRSH